jgi:hypothetical protein
VWIFGSPRSGSTWLWKLLAEHDHVVPINEPLPQLRGLIERNDFRRLPLQARGEHEFYRAAQPGLWRENLTRDEQDAVERVLGSKLRELGYGVPGAVRAEE